MKLISEFTENDIEFLITEDKKTGEKNYKIQGIFAQAEKKNRNGRIYPMPIIEKAVNKYDTEQVQRGRAVGELNHPEGPTVNLDKVSHKINKLEFQGNDVVGEASILKTPMGEVVKGLLDGDVTFGVSTRGMGSLSQRNNAIGLNDDYILNAVDILQDPSAPGAFVNGIMEGVEWVWNNGVVKPQTIEIMETEIKKAGRTDLYETQVRAFKNFLSILKSK